MQMDEGAEREGAGGGAVSGEVAGVTPASSVGPEAAVAAAPPSAEWGPLRRFLFARTDVDAEATAFYLNQAGRACLFISFTFLSLAILQLANEEAGCVADEEGSYAACTRTVYGARPSSMLAIMGTASGIASACFMPYAGAVVDFTDHRRWFGMVTAGVLAGTNALQAFLFAETWFVMMLLQATAAVMAFMGNAMVMWSYVKGLGAGSDAVLNSVTAAGRVWETTSMLVYIMVVVILSVALSLGPVDTGRVAQAIAATAGAVLLTMAYGRFRDRPASSTLPEGHSLMYAGVRKLATTWTELGEHAPQAQKFLICIMLMDAATGSFTNLAVTYLNQALGISGFMVSVFILVVLLFGIPGALVHRTLCDAYGHKKNMMGVLAYWVVLTSIFIAVLRGPEQSDIAIAFAPLYGIGYGAMYPAMNGFFAALVPVGRDVEMWGWNIFAALVLSWVPPLIFTVLNESGAGLGVAMIPLLAFHLLSLLVVSTLDEERGLADGSKSMVTSSAGPLKPTSTLVDDLEKPAPDQPAHEALAPEETV